MQTLINKILLLLILSSYTLFGCTICTVYSPDTRVSLEVRADENKIKTLNITWVLSKEFTEYLKQIYDKNQNTHLEKRELDPVEESILEYIEEKNYLVHISYDRVVNVDESLELSLEDTNSFIKNSRLHFNYLVTLNYDVIKDNALYIKIDDEEKYFILTFDKDQVKFDAPFAYEKLINKNSVVFNINSKVQKQEKTLEPKAEIKEESTTKENSASDSLLASFSKKVKDYLVKIENGDDYAMIVLLGISFLYGMLHALGPGHGKSLAFSYFASNRSSFVKAFWISQASAFIHIVGAFILVMVSVFVLQSMLNNFVNDSVEILTKISSVMIMLLAAYILYNKVNHKSCSCSSCCTPSSNENNSTWSVNKPDAKANLKPNFMKKDLYFVLTAGLIPCPGTVVLFIYAFILKTYFAVILASIFISLGMGLVIFASSFLGVSLHKFSERSHKITNALEILAPIVMFILGILLFLNAKIV